MICPSDREKYGSEKGSKTYAKSTCATYSKQSYQRRRRKQRKIVHEDALKRRGYKNDATQCCISSEIQWKHLNSVESHNDAGVGDQGVMETSGLEKNVDGCETSNRDGTRSMDASVEAGLALKTSSISKTTNNALMVCCIMRKRMQLSPYKNEAS